MVEDSFIAETQQNKKTASEIAGTLVLLLVCQNMAKPMTKMLLWVAA